MLFWSAFAAFRQTLSPPLRRLVLRALGLTVLALAALWVGLTDGIAYLLKTHPVSAQYPLVDGLLVFLAGAGLVVGLLYLLPAVTALVGGFYADEVAAVVEASDFPGDPPGAPLPTGRSVLTGARFALLAIGLNLLALTLIFVPVVNVAAFFAANAYLLGREYFEMAAARFRPLPDAARLRRENAGTVMAAGAVLAGLVLVPVLNLTLPIFATAFMVHVHKRIAARPRLARAAARGA